MARALTIIVTTLALAAIPVTNAVGAGWVTLQSTAPIADVNPGSPAIAVDPQGDVWLAVTQNNQAFVYERPPGGPLTEVVTGVGTGAQAPVIAAGADGTVVVAWQSVPDDAQAIVRPPGGPFSEPHSFSSFAAPHVDVLSDGTVLLATDGGLMATLWVRPPGGTFTSTSMGGGLDAFLGADAAGDTTLAWGSTLKAGFEVDARTRSGAGVLGDTDAVATQPSVPAGHTGSFSAGPVGVTADAAGDTAVTWNLFREDSTAMTSSDTIGVTVRPAGQSAWSSPQPLEVQSPAGATELSSSRTLFDAGGNLTVLWIDSSGPQVMTSSASPPTYAVPASPTAVGSAAPGLDSLDAAELAGGGTALLTSTSGSPGTATGSVRAPGATGFGAGTPLAPAGNASVGNVALAPDGLGDAYGAMLVKTGPGAGAFDYSLVTYDATPPSTGPISGATETMVGQPLSLSVSPTDGVSGVASVAWSLGDGATGSGTAVTHAWTAPGSYPVTATVTDNAGNTATTSSTVVVDAPPAAPSAPVITHASLSHTRFAVSSSPTAQTATAKKKPKHRKKPVKGTQIRFTLSQTATVKLAITHPTAGRKTGHTCKASTKKRLTKKQRCTATVTDGTLTRKNLKAGAAKISFSGRIGDKALKTGKHTLSIAATGATGLKAKPKTLHFATG